MSPEPESSEATFPALAGSPLAGGIEASEGTCASAEAALASAAREGDRAAFSRLYELYAPVVHGVLLSHVARNDADDLVHDVFLKALRSMDTLERPERFGAWICSIARNRARDAHKSRRTASELPEDLGDDFTSRGPRDASEKGAEDEQARLALASLRELPEAYRETLAMRLVEGLSGPEIARRTGLTPGSVRVNLCRGMKLLREKLGGE